MTQKEASQLNAKMMEFKAAWIKACAAAAFLHDSKFVVSTIHSRVHRIQSTDG